jgi:hypothetical protein
MFPAAGQVAWTRYRQSILVLNLWILFRHLAGATQEQTVGELHNIRFMNRVTGFRPFFRA